MKQIVIADRQQAIAALHAAEQRSRAVVDAMPLQIAVIDASATIVAVNAAWRQFAESNLATEPTVLGLGINYLEVCECVHGADAESATAAAAGLRRVLDGDAAEFTLEYACHSPAEQRWFLMTITPLPESGGAVVAHLNITARKIAERELQDSHRELEHRVTQRTAELAEALRQAETAHARKSRFLVAVSHDLRQPLQALGLYLAALARKLEAPQALDIAQKMSGSIAVVREFLDGLLDIAKLEHGTIEPQWQDLPVNALLQQVVTLNMPQARDKQLSLRLRPSPWSVRSDPLLLKRILENLVANAVRYTEHGGVLIGCRRRGERLRIEVWDTGIGIAAQAGEQVFEEYFQLDNPARTRTKGAGLGLAIVKHIAGLLDHPLSLRSCPGRGSMFAVSLPLSRAQPTGSPADAEPASESRPARSAIVLVVDDDPAILEAVDLMLSSEGFQVHTAAGGADAIARLGQGLSPDILISDYRLPQTSGLDLVRKTRALLGTDVPAIILTGDTMIQEAGADLPGACRILHKPVDGDRLIALIRQAIS